jgi:putative flippase GtrA
MKSIDIIFAVVCGLLVSWLVVDFAPSFDGAPYRTIGRVSFIILPVLSVFGLWLTDSIGKKILLAKQTGRFFLVGVFADVIDIKIFQLLFFLIPFYSLILKAISFLVATFVKYWWNKYWAFEKHEKDGIKKEAAQFFAVTLVGLALNVGSFYYFTKIMGPQFSMQVRLWTEFSIILAALVAAVWNFLGYKFIVFKK